MRINKARFVFGLQPKYTVWMGSIRTYPITHTFFKKIVFTVSKYIEFKRKERFYEVRYEEPYILWYLLRYKIYNNKVGFIKKEDYSESYYEEVLQKAKKEYLEKYNISY